LTRFPKPRIAECSENYARHWRMSTKKSKSEASKSKATPVCCHSTVNEYILVARRTAVRRGNPQFTNPAAIEPPLVSQSSFERVVEELKLSPSEYVTSPKLRDWVSRNKDQKYVPSELLKALGFEVSTGL
jgi:hypothetical protein